MNEERQRLSIEELQLLPEYQVLTPKQQLFCATYCQGGLDTGAYDHVNAVQTAYGCASRDIARVMSYAMMSNIRIIAVLNRHFQKTPTEEFVMLLDRAINNKKVSTAQVQALRMKCDLLKQDHSLPPIGDHGKDSVIERSVQKIRKPKAVKPPKKEAVPKTVAPAFTPTPEAPF